MMLTMTSFGSGGFKNVKTLQVRSPLGGEVATGSASTELSMLHLCVPVPECSISEPVPGPGLRDTECIVLPARRVKDWQAADTRDSTHCFYWTKR